MNVDLKGMASVLREAVQKIARNTRAFSDEVDDIRYVAATLENVIEPSDAWAVVEWCGNNAADFNRHSGVCYVTWIGSDLDARSTKGATWREAITRAMAEDKAMAERAGAEAR